MASDEDAAGEEEMTFLEHLEDLRWTIMKSVIALGLSAIIVGFGITAFANLLNWPLETALGPDSAQGLITTSPIDVFAVWINIALIGGITLALPFVLYFIAQFIAPGLTERERAVLRPGCLAAFALFLVGSAFAFFFVIPISLKASVTINEMFGFQVLWTAAKYYGLLLWMTVGIGLSFEFPLIIIVMIYSGLVDTAQLKRFRPYFVVVFLVLAAVITPTNDPLTFLIVAAPMQILLEIALIVGKRFEEKRLEEEIESGL